LIIGAMKAGTSALVRGVAHHDFVFGAEGKEVHFFDRHYDKGFDWYQARFDSRGPATAFGEGTPYLGNRVAMGRLIEDLPESKLIAILRQPADRAYSHYWHNCRRGRETLSFLDALEAEGERTRPNDTKFDYRNLGRYSEQLIDIAPSLPSKRLLVLLNEDLKFNRDSSLRSVWEFLDVDPDLGRNEIPKRSTRQRYWRATKNRVKRRSDDRSYPPLDPKIRAALTEQFESDILDLQAYLGQDLGTWLK
jgi:hypothetical protein